MKVRLYINNISEYLNTVGILYTRIQDHQGKLSSRLSLLLITKLTIYYNNFQLDSNLQTKTEPSTSTTKL